LTVAFPRSGALRFAGMPRLLVTGPEGQYVVELHAQTTLGRQPGNAVQVLDKSVSREHCVIERRGTEFVIRDLDTRNGTFVNHELVEGERRLRHGDEIALGGWRATFDASHRGVTGLPVFSQPTMQVAALPVQVTAPPPGAIGFFSQTRTQPIATYFAEQVAEARRVHTTPVEMVDSERNIGREIDARTAFLPGDQVAGNLPQLILDYDRLRLANELSREIALERDLVSLLNKVLASVLKLVAADRGVIFLKDEEGALIPSASMRRDGSVQPITVSSTILGHVMKERTSVITDDAAFDFRGAHGKKPGSLVGLRIGSAVVAPLLHKDDLLGVLWLDSEALARFQSKDLELTTLIAAQAALFIEVNVLGRRLEHEAVARDQFRRLLSENLAERVLSGEMAVERGGQLVSCTVFNSDIRGFTRLSQHQQPQVLVETLNEYFEKMVDAIFDFDGTLDKFMGDGIMALWGAPASRPDDAVRAVSSALRQLELLDQLNAIRVSRQGAPPLQVGIGIHTGPVVAGYIGSPRALSYTVIGDTANTSARLCAIAEGGQILVSQQTLEHLGGQFQYQALAAVSLKGLEQPMPVFEIKRGG
jgi:adenylate cyclase